MTASYRDLESLGHAIDTLKQLPPDGKRQLTSDRLVEILVGEVEHLYAAFIGRKWDGPPSADNGAVDGTGVTKEAPANAPAGASPSPAAPSPEELVAGAVPAEALADLTWNGFAAMLATHPSAGPAAAVIGSWLRSRNLQFDHAQPEQLLEMHRAMDDWYAQRDAQLAPAVNQAGLPVAVPAAPPQRPGVGFPTAPAVRGPAPMAGVAVQQAPPVVLPQPGAQAAMDVCPRCGGPTRTGMGKFGEFHACNNQPECKGINGKGLLWSSANKWLTLWAQYHQAPQ